MPLSKSGLSTRLKDEIESNFGAAPFVADLQKFTDALANAIVDEIVENLRMSLSSNDIPISPGTFKDSTAALITGKGVSDSVTLNGKFT